MMRFEEAYEGWNAKRPTQAQAPSLLGVSERTFRRQIGRYEAEALEGLLDQRLTRASARRAPVDEVMGLVDLYRRHYPGWNVRHFHSFYRRDHGGQRSYTWVKLRLQDAGAVAVTSRHNPATAFSAYSGH